MLDAISYPAGFVGLGEAMKILDQSESTIDRLVRQERVAVRFVHRQGRKDERVYSREDLERCVKEREKRRAIRPPSANQAVIPAAARVPADRLLELVTRRLDGQEPAVPLTQKLWLTIEEARELSGLARRDLVALCQAAFRRQAEPLPGALRVRKSGGWKILRKSLEAWEG